MVRKLKAGCISCDCIQYNMFRCDVYCCCLELFVQPPRVVLEHLQNLMHWTPKSTFAKRFPWKRQSDKSTKSSKTKKDHGSTGSTPKRSTDSKKVPSHSPLMGLLGLCFSAPMSLLWQVHMLFWFWCSFNGHGMQVLEVWKWGTSTIFSFNEFRKPACVMGRSGKGSGFKDLRGIPPTCLWPKFHTCIFASTAMSAVGFLEPLPFGHLRS